MSEELGRGLDWVRGNRRLHRAWTAEVVRLWDCLFLIKTIMIAFVKGLLSSMLCYWVGTFNPLHLPHFANEEGKARSHEA